MDFLPVFLQLTGRSCLVVGGGDIAARKLSLLLRAGARVTVVAPEICQAITDQTTGEDVTIAERAFADSDLDGCCVVIAATNDISVNAIVSERCHQRAIPVNVVDDPSRCSFIMPSIIDRSPVIVAVSTGGASPVLARLLRSRLEALIPHGLGRLARLCGEFRGAVKKVISNPNQRRNFWEQVLHGPIAEQVYAGHEQAARLNLARALQQSDPAAGDVGEVYLVGSGPGDPDLLTFRALRLMQQADVVVHDRLVTEEILNLTRRDADRIYAGKSRGDHAIAQVGINALLVRLAKQGKRVLRLKGGDPFIFGRGGEEIETLAEEGIPFQVVPGITAASGCAAYAGIPLTHRDYSQSCLFVTGHLKDGAVNLNWDTLIRPKQTLVIYMGLVGLPVICHELQRHGLSADMPAALVEQGTTRHQRVHTGTISTLPAIVAASGAQAPTLIIIGEVVRLREKLDWFEPRQGRNLSSDETLATRA